MSSRRRGVSPSAKQLSNDLASTLNQPGSTSSPRSTGSSYLPTLLEATLLAIYPATLVLGSLFSILNPQSRNTPYSSATQSHPASIAPSYFARKSNVFNVYFVKIGWFWITSAFFLFTFSHTSLGPRWRPVLTPRRIAAVVRYALVTAVWTALTQWFFGPAIIDRGFRFTGGQCELVYGDDVEAQQRLAGMSDARELLTHAACKAVGGTWQGGHDISGHVFILILGSAMLWLEILPAVLVASGLREDRRIRMADGAIKSAAVETPDRTDGGIEVPRDLGFGVKAALGVAGLSWWMLLMTASYFHTWFEKFTGLLVAFIAIYTIYFLPRSIPTLRRVVGMPGL